MIARFTILLPFNVVIQAMAKLEPVDQQWGNHKVRVHPPRQAIQPPTIYLSTGVPLSMQETIVRLTAAEEPRIAEGITMDGQQCYFADLLVLDFIAPDFDRTDPRPEEKDKIKDPPNETVFVLANEVLDRLRAVIRRGKIKPIHADRTHHLVQYLKDDGSALAMEADKVRMIVRMPLVWDTPAITEVTWNLAQNTAEVPALHKWDQLMLDAIAVMPDRGAAIALMNVALETFAIWMNNILANHPSGEHSLYTYVNNREQWMQQPSVSDRFDGLLRALSGKSLKDNPSLWEAFKLIRNARNTFMHEGKVGYKKAVDDLSVKEVYELIDSARDVIKWVEQLLPIEERRKKYPNANDFMFKVN
jgi:hypothetical protein